MIREGMHMKTRSPGFARRCRTTAFASLVFVAGCDHSATSATSPAPPSPSSPTASASSTSSTSPPSQTLTSPDAGATTAASAAVDGGRDVPPPGPPPQKVARSGKTWPFHAWNRAEAVTYNEFPMRPGVQLLAYDDIHGWTPHLVDRKALDETKARRAIELVTATNGDVEVSKCPFPRHAVVLYEDAVPVATINVCFSCGDIILWPPWETPPNWDKLTDREMKERMARHDKQLKLYEKTFPKWKTFFTTDVGFTIDESLH